MRKQKRNVLPAPKHQNNLGSALFSGVFQGFSFGAGNSLAHNLFKIPPSTTNKFSPCEILKHQYFDSCNLNSMSEPNKCQQLYEDLQLICSKEM